MNRFFIKQELLDEQDFKHLLPFFVDEASTLRAELKACKSELDLNKIRLLAHKLCGSSGSFGARLIEEESSKLETMARQPAADPLILDGIDRLCNIIDDTIAFAKKEYGLK